MHEHDVADPFFSLSGLERRSERCCSGCRSSQGSTNHPDQAKPLVIGGHHRFLVSEDDPPRRRAAVLLSLRAGDDGGLQIARAAIR
jgi:hypothetical protein